MRSSHSLGLQQQPAVSAPRWRSVLHTPPCSPSSSGRALRLSVRAAKDGQDDKIKREEKKADFSALWAQRVKNFFSGRRKYLEEADRGAGDDAVKAQQAAMLREEEKMQERKQQLVAKRQELVQQTYGDEAAELGQELLAADIAQANIQLQTSPLTKAAMAVVQVRDLLRALLLSPFTAMAAIMRAWQETFKSQRYQNFLMSEGERTWYWRNRMENERWFWEVYVWDRLLFPVFCVFAYEWLVPNHWVWALLVPYVVWSWLGGEIITPLTPEFWLLAYFGFYQKVWPALSAWLASNVLAW